MQIIFLLIRVYILANTNYVIALCNHYGLLKVKSISFSDVQLRIPDSPGKKTLMNHFSLQQCRH